jgi:hypothetical protein
VSIITPLKVAEFWQNVGLQMFEVINLKYYSIEMVSFNLTYFSIDSGDSLTEVFCVWNRSVSSQINSRK